MPINPEHGQVGRLTIENQVVSEFCRPTSLALAAIPSHSGEREVNRVSSEPVGEIHIALHGERVSVETKYSFAEGIYHDKRS